MLTLKQIIFACVLCFALLTTAAAQDSPSASAQRSSLTITAAAHGERVRITAPASVVQMHVEVYAPGGEKLFDQEIRGGNVFDWHLQDGQAQRLAPGAYVCVVTAKSVSGRLTQRIGTVTVAENSASVQPAGSPQLSVQQTQAIGPVEEDSSWTIAGKDEPQTPTLIANDGTDGQMIRGRGALTFRIGNFFSGIDQEQMRLTEAGNLGIGISEPKAKLDVAGTIRAQRFLVVKPGQTSKAAGDSEQTTDAADLVQPLVAGTGTQNQIAKWTDNSGTLGNSVITETAGGNVGLGTASPAGKLHVSGTGTQLSIFQSTDNGAVQFRLKSNSTNRRFVALNSADSVQSQIIFNDNGAFEFVGPTVAAQRLSILSSGNVGIGTTNPQSKLDVAGDINVTGNAVIGGNIAAKYQDVAEWVQARKPIAPGTLVILDSGFANAVVPSGRAYDTRVAGVISARPGVILGEAGSGKVLVATTGRVRVMADATRNPIKIGDLLVTSDKPGVAMKSLPIIVRGVRIHRPGTIVGKALEPLANGQGRILVLLSLQ